jgi:hypothetical protein
MQYKIDIKIDIKKVKVASSTEKSIASLGAMSR